jgi:serine/threonine protein kinase
MSLPATLDVGTVIGGHYIIDGLINNGGFGAVYRGIDTSETNRICAIKETYDVTPASRRQALIEVSVLFTFRNSHLPTVYDAFEANGRFYLVMQMIEGQNLLQLLKGRVPNGIVGEQIPYQLSTGPCTEAEVLAWLVPIMNVLQELHSRNPAVIHRDIKPGNIILTPQQTTVLVDFGLTKLYDPDSTTRTIGRAVSEGFSPIEQYVGKTSPQSDIYSTAATMYFLLTNRLPPAATSRVMRDDLVAPRALNPALSPHIEQAMMKGLAVDANQRFQSMQEFAQAVQGTTFDSHNEPTLPGMPAFNGPVPTPGNAQPTVAARQGGAMPTQGFIVGSGSGIQFSPGNPNQSQAGNGMYPNQSGMQTIYQSPPQTPAYPVPKWQFPGAPYPQTHGSAQGNPPAPYPYLPPSPDVKRVAKPRPAVVPYAKPLPKPSNQGCLWGLLQGVLAAALVLLSRQSSDFYLATFVGFFFYLLAGFFTTRHGGGFFRGSWAGFWAGIYSTLIFWIALGLGLAFEFFSQLQALGKSSPGLSPPDMSNQAWQKIAPAWPAIPFFLPQRPEWVNVLALFLLGAVLAWFLGLSGGIIGQIRYAARQSQS